MGDIRLSSTTRTDRLTALLNRFESTSSPCILKLYGGVIPATAITNNDANLLAELTLNKPIGTISGANLTLDVSGVVGTATAAGTITYARIVLSAGAVVLDCAVGADKPMTMPNYDVVIGTAVTISSFVISEGNA